MHPDYREPAPGHALLRWLTTDLAAAGFTELDLDGRRRPVMPRAMREPRHDGG